MKELKIKNFEVLPFKDTQAIETHKHMPKMHQLCVAVGKRASGKTTFLTNLLEHLPIDRLFIISPSMKSNKGLMDRLKGMCDEIDIFDDPDDVSCLEEIKGRIEQERDDLETYWEDIKRYNKMMKKVNSRHQFVDIDDEDMLSFFTAGRFQEPKHKWGGRKPCVSILIDDAQGSALYKGRKLNQFCIYHRHIGGFKKGGALGCSIFFAIQNYKSQSGGLSRTIRNNTTSLVVFKNKDEKEMKEISKEVNGEVDEETFNRVYDQAFDGEGEHNCLFIDLHKKKDQPSMFRRNLDTYLVL